MPVRAEGSGGPAELPAHRGSKKKMDDEIWRVRALVRPARGVAQERRPDAPVSRNEVRAPYLVRAEVKKKCCCV